MYPLCVHRRSYYAGLQVWGSFWGHQGGGGANRAGGGVKLSWTIYIYVYTYIYSYIYIYIAAVVMVFFRLPQGNVFLATIDMVAPVSNTPRYSRPPSRIRTQNTRSRAPSERPCQNSAGQVTSNPLFRNLLAILMKQLLFLALPSSPHLCSRLAPCSRWACVCERVVGPDCPPEGSEFPPGLGLGLPPFLSWFLLSLSGWLLAPAPLPP